MTRLDTRLPTWRRSAWLTALCWLVVFLGVILPVGWGLGSLIRLYVKIRL